YNDAVRQDSVAQELLRRELIAANEAAAARDRLFEAQKRLDVEQKRLELQRGTIDTRLAAQQAEVERLERIVDFRRNELESMNVVAGHRGILQQLDLEIGQWVSPGMQLARVVEPERLKAVLRIPATQAVDIAL